jgi:hypothetical protein
VAGCVARKGRKKFGINIATFWPLFSLPFYFAGTKRGPRVTPVATGKVSRSGADAHGIIAALRATFPGTTYVRIDRLLGQRPPCLEGSFLQRRFRLGVSFLRNQLVEASPQVFDGGKIQLSTEASRPDLLSPHAPQLGVHLAHGNAPLHPTT